MIVKQKQYSKLEFDCSEKDVIIISGETQTSDPQIIFIERKNLQKVIDVLKSQLK